MKVSTSGFLSLFALHSAMELSSATTPLLFRGILLDDLSRPVPNAYVQFWQTDSNGVYDHPQSISDRGELNPSFQYFGTDQTNDNGEFFFKTYKPGLYPSRPIAHIHFRVFVDGEDVLTSQFYFAGENGGNPSMLTLDLQETTDDGVLSLVTQKTVAIDLGGGGTQAITPSQTSGPYYPTVDFFGFDNDLTTSWSGENRTLVPSPMNQTQLEPSPSPEQSAKADVTDKPTSSPQKNEPPVVPSPEGTQNTGSTDTPTSQLNDPSGTDTKSRAFSLGAFFALSSSTFCFLFAALI